MKGTPIPKEPQRVLPGERREESVSEKVANLVVATRNLLAYMEESPVFDKLADAGCGGVDASAPSDSMSLSAMFAGPLPRWRGK